MILRSEWQKCPDWRCAERIGSVQQVSLQSGIERSATEQEGVAR